MTLRSPTRVSLLAAVVGVTVALTGLGSAAHATKNPGVAGPGWELAAFSAAAADFKVPATVLLATSYALTRWETHTGRPSVAGGYGPMNLVDPAGVDGRGDPSRTRAPDNSTSALHRAAVLAGLTDAAVRTDPTANIRAGAALLATEARQLDNGKLPATVGGWYPGVARYIGAADTLVAREFADDVFAIVRTGVAGSTADRQRMHLDAQPGVHPDRAGLAALHLRAAASVPAAECPPGLDCRFIPAAFAQNTPGDPSDYGNYDPANRPADMRIRYIVIHDTEGSYDGTIAQFQDPHGGVAAHYVIRSSDGQVTQMVRTKDVAPHAGNWYVNMHSIGIEHEGIAAQGATWYTEAQYRSSARLVSYLAARYHIPLNRAHILGHDNVPGPLASFTAGMHWDPGPFWDWNYYMQLLGARQQTPRASTARVVTIAPNFATNVVPVTGCDTDPPGPNEPASFVYLHTAPSENAPLLSDIALHPDGSPGTNQICDTGDKAAAGQRFAVAERQGDWTAIWYAGQKAWLHDLRVTAPAVAVTITPKPGLSSIPVYGRAYPEPAAFTGSQVPLQTVSPLQFSITPGQRYVAADLARADYYQSATFDGSGPGDRTMVRGKDLYILIYFGHRQAYVKASDVTVF